MSSSYWRWLVPLALAAASLAVPARRFRPETVGPAVSLCRDHLRTDYPAAAQRRAGFRLDHDGSLLGLFTMQDALSGFSNMTVWLIVAAFLFARGFVQTRLGERIAYTIVSRFGASPLRLGYSIVLADLVMAPMTPSNTARAGGILFPITLSVARAFGSEPGPTAGRIGAFLMTTLYQGDLVVSAMFLTATAPNPLVAEFARQGSGIAVSWTTWALAASRAWHRGARASCP